MRILLDTCTFLWIAEGSTQLSRTAAAAYADRDNETFLSVASAWEIAIKHSCGKLPLPSPIDEWVLKMRAKGDTLPLAIDEESAIHVARLPRLHTDPFDRILVAQAIIHGMTILTPDPFIRSYPARTLW